MFKLKTERWGEVDVSFQHRNPDKMPLSEKHIEPGTGCYIVHAMTSPEKYLAHGHSSLIPPDQFCKSRGRKIALKQALYALDATPDERKLFWEAYFEATKPQVKS